jgi:hypothetical protein
MARHKKTQANIDLVIQFASVGQPQENIARYLDITAKTLRSNYRHELDNAKSSAVAAMGGKLYQTGMDGNVPAMMFYLKAQGGWNDKPDQTVNVNHKTDLPSLMAQGRQRALEASIIEMEPIESEEVDETDGHTIN